MWGKNVRAAISRENWNSLRWVLGCTNERPYYCSVDTHRFGRQVPRACTICGAAGNRFELHEQWQYDDEQLTQRLKGLIPICQSCHLSMHFGRAKQLELSDKAEQHLAKVNKWSKTQTKTHIKDAFRKWAKRSQDQYTLDLSWLEQWIPESKIHLDWIEQPKRWAGDRLDSIVWARNLLQSNALIIDTETTGLLDKPSVEVIELAVLTMSGTILYQSHFRPRYRIPKRVTEINGLTNEILKNEPRFKDEHTKVFEMLNSRIVVSYNTRFDKGVIIRTCGLNKMEPPDCRWECAMWAYRAFQESGKLLPLPRAKHNALGDCRALLRLIKIMAKG